MSSRLLRSSVATATLGLLLVAAAPEATTSAAEDDDEIRTDPGSIAGYDLTAEAAPVTVRIYERYIPIPTDPGEPNLSVSPGYSLATLGAGPVSRSVSSLLWPGAGIGDGFGTFAEEFGMDPETEYPLRAAASYPGGPFEAEQETLPGGGMRASAAGLDVEAVADVGGELVPLLLDAGTARSVSRTTAEDGVATATAESSLTDLSLLGGLVTVDGLRTHLVATTDGVEAEVRGATDVLGLTVAGTRYAVGRDGVEIESEDEDGPFDDQPALPLRLLGLLDLSDLIGVTVEGGLVEDLEEEEGLAGAGRRAEGVTITLDLGLLFELVDLLPTDVLVELLPDDLRGQIAPLLRMSPTVEIALGYAEVEVAASEPITFEPPDLPPPADPPAPPPPPTDLGDVGSAPDLGATGDVGSSLDDLDTDLSAPPVAAPPPSDADAGPPEVAMPVASVREPPGPIALAGQLLALIGLLTGLGAWGLDRLRGAAFAVAPLAGGVCQRGATSGVPDLRALE